MRRGYRRTAYSVPVESALTGQERNTLAKREPQLGSVRLNSPTEFPSVYSHRLLRTIRANPDRDYRA